MIEKLLQKEVQEFIQQHANDDEQKLLLKYKTVFNVPASVIAWQISGKRKAKTKIPLYYNTASIVYPPGVNLEQSSSEQTAVFKASLLSELLPATKALADLTGGLGVDSFFISKKFDHVTYVEPNKELLDYARHNHIELKAENIRHQLSTAEEFLNSSAKKFDCFFIDPSRRSAANKKVFKLADCEPNVVNLLPAIFDRSDYLMVKASPLLDLQHALHELDCVKHVWVVALTNEVKELLFWCTKKQETDPMVTAVNLGSDHQRFTFQPSSERNAQAAVSEPLNYLYEPNASILKAGAFKILAERFSVAKLHPNTHVYTSLNLVHDFPGRVFATDALLKADPKDIGRHFPDGKTNVITRNYPLSSDELKKKFKLQDGGEKYLIACSGEKQKFLIAASRLK